MRPRFAVAALAPKSYILATISVVVLILLPAAARAYTLPEVVGKMTTAEKKLQSVGFDFSQDVTFTQMQTTSTVKGKALFARPNKLRIEKSAPDHQLTVSDGKTMWVYNPAVKQVWKGAMRSWVDASMVPQGLIPLAGYMEDLQKRFNLSLKDGPPGTVVLVADPKDASVGYALELVVSTDKWIPFRTTYRSDTGLVVTKLSDITFNPAVGPDAFKFKAPKGADIIPLN